MSLEGEEPKLAALRARLRRADFDAIDCHIASLCARGHADDKKRELMFVLAARVSQSLREGHSCLYLSELAGLHWGTTRLEEEGSTPSEFVFPSIEEIGETLRSSHAVTVKQLNTDLFPLRQRAATPLVFDDRDRLYTSRFFDHEVRLSEDIVRFLSSEMASSQPSSSWLSDRLDHYFSAPEGADVADYRDLQREAAERTVRQRLSIISGGPGTGKTSTVVKILAVLSELAVMTSGVAPRVLLLAPTGKAAARLNESIDHALQLLVVPEEIASSIRPSAMTIHRALGVRPGSANRYVRNRDFPFSADIVIIDEGSMIDLAVMRNVCEALAEGARLILLGDRHQLASVEAGSVFSELCSSLSKQPHDCVVELKRSFRFTDDSGVGAAANAIKRGDAAATLSLLREKRSDLTWHPQLDESNSLEQLLNRAVTQLTPALAAPDPETALREVSRFRILCAHRLGTFGVEQVNQLLLDRLVHKGLVPPSRHLARGHLLMVLENDPALGLSNGDVGLVWPDEGGRLWICFGTQGKVRRISPTQIPAHELCFAMTIHKSQGSEYDEVAVVLPPVDSPILSRELLYTAVTRARSSVQMFASAASLQHALQTKVIRRSGLSFAIQNRLSFESQL